MLHDKGSYRFSCHTHKMCAILRFLLSMAQHEFMHLCNTESIKYK